MRLHINFIKIIFFYTFAQLFILGCNYNPLGGSHSDIQNGDNYFLNTPSSFDITGVLVSNNKIQLAWSSSTRVDDYTVSYGTSSGNYSINANSCTAIKQTVCTVANLTNGQILYIKVFARNRYGKTASKSEAVATPQPFSLNVLSTSNASIIKWIDVSGGLGNTTYSLQYGTNSASLNQSVASISNAYLLTGLLDGNTYYYTVTATNPAGTITSLMSSSLIINPPSAPTFAGAPLVSSSQVTLNWNVAVGAGTLRYTLAKSSKSGGPYENVATCTQINALTCSESASSLLAGNSYYYVVYATNEGGDSPFSSEAIALTIPSIPTGLSLSAPNSSTNNLSWMGSSGNANVTYNIYRSTVSPVDTSNIANKIASLNSTQIAQITTYTDSGPFVENTVYYYALTASNSSGTSGASQQKSITSALLTASTLTSPSVTSSSINLNWTSAAGNANVNYIIYRSLSSSAGNLGSIIYSNTLSVGATKSYTDSALSENTNYYYTIIANNDRPNSIGIQSAKTTIITSLGSPISLSLQSVTTSSASFNWSMANGNSSVTYRLFRSATSTVNTTIGNEIYSSNSATSYTDTSLSASTNYYYAVTVTNGQNTITSSPALQVVTLPNTPSAPTASAINRVITLTWAQSPSAGNATITYNVQRYRLVGDTPVDVSGCLNITDASRTCTDIVPTADGLPYYYIVKAVTLGGNSPSYSAASVVTPVAQFSSFTPTTNITTSPSAQITLNWSGGSGATNFLVYSSTTAGGSAPPAGTATTCTSTPCVLSASVGNIFYYSLVGSNTGINSTATRTSNEISVTVNDTPITSVVAQTSQVTIGWSSVLNATNYKIYYSTSSTAGIAGKTLGCDAGLSLSCTVTGLTNGTQYYFVIAITRSVGGTFIGSEFLATPISSFSITSLASASSTSANITWELALGATSYDIKYGTSSGNYSEGNVSVAASVSQPYLITGLSAGSTYYFMVTAKNNSGAVDAISEVQLVQQVGTPTGLSITSVTKNSTTLSWNILTGNPLTTYKIYRSDINLTPFVANPTAAVCSVSSLTNTNTCTDSGLNENTIYYYVISALNSAGESAVSTPAVQGITSLNTAPTNLFVSNVNINSATLNWNFNQGNAPVIYNLYQSTTGANGSWGSAIYTGNNLSTSSTGLSENTTYYYKVSAKNSALNATEQFSPVINFTTALQTAPIINSVTNITNNSATINWSLSAGTAPVTYNLYRSLTSNPSNWGSPIFTGTGLSFSDSGLSENTNYYYMVSATNNAPGAMGINSNEFQMSTKIQNPPVISVTNVTDTSVSLKWTSVLGSNSVTYKLYRSTVPGVVANGVLLATNPSNNVYTDTTVTDSKIYYYVVTATNSQNTVTSTPETQIVTLPKIPNSPTISATGNTVTLNWVSNSTGNASITYSVSRSRSAASGYAPVSGCTNISNPLTCVDTVSADGAAFYYTISASNSNGSSLSASSPTSVIPITAISSINISTTTTQINLAWSGGSGATGFKVYQSLVANQSSPNNSGTVTACTASPCSFAGTANQTVYYTIVGNNTGVNSTAQTLSAEVSGTPLSSANLMVSAGSSQVTVLWDNTIANATNFKVYYSTVPGQALSSGTLGCDALLGSSCVISGLTNGQVYYFALLVTRSVGGNFQSTEVTGIPISTFSIISISPTVNSATVTWGSAAGANSYDISYGTSSLLYTTTVTVTPGAGSTQSSLITSLNPGTQYFFTVTAKNANGSVMANAEMSTVTTPNAPANIKIISLGYNSATIQVNNNFANVGTTYKIYHSTQSGFNTSDNTAVFGCFAYVNSASPTTLSCVDNTGIVQNTKYYFKAIAITDAIGGNSSQTSADSNVISATTQFDPASSFIVSVSNVTDKTLTLSWTLSVGSENITYTVFQSDIANASVTGAAINCSPAITPTAPGALNTCNVTGLSENKNYYFAVTASNNAPNPASILLTPDASATTPFSSTTNLAITSSNVTGTSITLNWLFNIGNSPVNFIIKQNGSAVNAANISGCSLNNVTASSTQISCIVSALTENTNYSFVVQATNNATGGSSTISSNTLSLPTLPITIPSGLSLSIPSVGNIQAQWNAYAAGNVNVTYLVYASTNSSVAITSSNLFCTVLPNNAVRTSCTNNQVQSLSLVVGTVYYFVIVASNSSGNSSPSSPSTSFKYDAPQITASPTITNGPASGSGIVSGSGVSLVGNIGTWTDTSNCTYQFYANMIAISGATGSISATNPNVTYVTTSSDICKIISFSVTCTNPISSNTAYNSSPDNSVGINTTAILSDYSNRVSLIGGNTLNITGKNQIKSFINQIITNKIPIPDVFYPLLASQNAGIGTKIFDLYCDLHNGTIASGLTWDNTGGIISNSSGLATIPSLFSSSSSTLIAVARSPTTTANDRGIIGYTGSSTNNSFGYGGNFSSIKFENFSSNPSVISYPFAPSRFDYWAVSLNGTSLNMQVNEFQHTDTSSSTKNGGLILGSFNNTAGTGLQDYMAMAAAWTTNAFSLLNMETVRRAFQSTLGSSLQNYPKFMYIGNSQTTKANICNILSDGSLSGCVAGTPTFVTPVGTARYNNFLYVTNNSSAGISVCVINQVTGAMTSPCTSVTTAMPTSSYGVTISKGLNSVYLYVGGVTTVTKCTINTSTGALTSCTATTLVGMQVQGLSYVYLNTPYLYVTNRSGNAINKCSINTATGNIITPCTPYGGIGLGGPTGIAVFNNYMYIANAGSNAVVKCTVNVSDGSLTSCGIATSSTVNPPSSGSYSSTEGVAIINDTLYIANWGSNTVIKCKISITDGSLSGCLSTGSGVAFSGPIGMSF
ncbi:fibronectin type III domain-containing protein [Fluviispira vulneris]|uniref:fibronectin type III domain-containing protein n=1 Tax=Fluviispira vulneris TaxID=2763012 RepID=UPI0016456CD0|nr:fibronectin type III domain-containing protein [Fluviispira vulneris]